MNSRDSITFILFSIICFFFLSYSEAKYNKAIESQINPLKISSKALNGAALDKSPRNTLDSKEVLLSSKYFLS